jgi:thioredoxin reductase (NADPH)
MLRVTNLVTNQGLRKSFMRSPSRRKPSGRRKINMYDLIIIGNGPAGCSAAIYARRSGMKVLMTGKDGGSLARAHLIENYYGLAEPVSGAVLARQGLQQVLKLGVDFKEEEVTGVGFGTGFEVTTTADVYSGTTLILATGAAKATLPLPGLEQFEGKGVSYCAVCDGFFFRKKKVAVLGSGAYALHEAQVLQPLAAEVVLLTNGEAAPSSDFTSYTTKVSALEGDNKLRQVLLADGTRLEIDGLFVALGTADTNALARKLGLVTKGRFLEVTAQMQTNIPGVFAAGDCTGALPQIVTAVYQGAIAGLQAFSFMKQQA